MTTAKHHVLSIALLISSVHLSACALVEEDVTTSSSEVGCPAWGCGENLTGLEVLTEQSALYDNRGNPTGSVQDFIIDGQSHQLRVVNSAFQGGRPGQPPVTGAGVVGAVLVTQQRGAASPEEFHITNYYTVFGVPIYVIEDDDGEALCPGGGEIAPGAVLMANERYDAAAKTVSVSGPVVQGWFNIACMGSVLAKLKFNGYDPEIDDPQDPNYTTAAQRQAMIKAYTADYCGTGTSFTQDHQPLELTNRSGTVQRGAPITTPEAIWDEFGAVALDVPRLQSQFPDIMDDIIAECGGALPGWPANPSDWPTPEADIKTYNP